MKLYYYEHCRSIARGMLQRYGTKSRALEECARNRDSPLTTDAGRKFWTEVYQNLEIVVDSGGAK